ncbi:MAG TPA: hypothetical protein DCP32_11895 [Anaerolineaceae bacterium]|nr:hypothetical protein [Anaerolineaceae bacterium]HBA91894.1 hypothetical protein [Anaerolineaceae bacterium]
MVVLCEVSYKLRLNQEVLATDNSGVVIPGVIQGYMVRGGQVLIIVAHDPKKVSLPDALMRLYRGGIWVLNYYPAEQVLPAIT